MCEYIYLLKEREFIKTQENVFKLGKTKQKNLARISSYPNGTQLMIQMMCDNCDYIESNLIKLFTQKFIRRKDIGYEYFEGNYHHMIQYIFKEIEGNHPEQIDSNHCFVIDSFSKLKKISNIYKISITDKQKQCGYATVFNEVDGYGLGDEYRDGYYHYVIEERGRENDLQHFIECCLSNISLCHSNITKEIVIRDKVEKLRNFQSHYEDCNLIINYDKLIKDICLIAYDPFHSPNDNQSENKVCSFKSLIKFLLYAYLLSSVIILIR